MDGPGFPPNPSEELVLRCKSLCCVGEGAELRQTRPGRKNKNTNGQSFRLCHVDMQTEADAETRKDTHIQNCTETRKNTCRLAHQDMHLMLLFCATEARRWGGGHELAFEVARMRSRGEKESVGETCGSVGANVRE